MAYTFGFADNVSYGASDVNSVINKLVTSGVADVYFDGLNYNTSDLNKIANAVAESGVTFGSGASMKVVGNGTGTVKVTAGTAFMSDGANITVDSDGVVLEYTQGQKNYVYIQNNLLASNTIDIVCGLTGGGSDTVPLAEISADGTITDTRKFCRGKTAGYQSAVNQTKIIEIPFSFTTNYIGKNQTISVDLGGRQYSRIVNLTSAEGTTTGAMMGYCNLNDNSYYSLHKDSSNGYTVRNDKLRIFSDIGSRGDDTVDVTFDLSGTTLNCNFRAVCGNSRSEIEYTLSGTAVFLLC